VLYRVDLVTVVVGWKISSCYWLEESRCVVVVGRLIVGLFCGCNYVGVEIPLDELQISFGGGSSVARHVKTGAV